MTQPIEGFLERELHFLQETAKSFAERYPADAKGLILEQGRSVDPHLDRLIEGFALLAGRVRHKIDSEFPDFTESLLQVLYPHLSLVIPSMAIAQVELPAGRPAPRTGWRLDKGTSVFSQAFGVNAETLQYRLAYPATVWPIELTRVTWETTPFEPLMRPPQGTVAVLRMQFTCKDGLTWDDLDLDRLRLHLTGERQMMAALYEILFNRCLGVAFQAPNRGAMADTSRPPLRFPADQSLFQVGLDLDENLLDFPPESFIGYRHLMELLSFPQKYLFADLAGWKNLHGRRFGSHVEVLLYLSQTQENLERGMSVNNCLLGCVPVVNLFEKSCEPIRVDHHTHDYRVVPSRRQPKAMEVYQVQSVRSIDADTGKLRDFWPFYTGRFAQTVGQNAFYHVTRRESVLEDVPGTEVYLTLIDPEFHPGKPSNQVLDVQALCTNRHYPFKYQQAGDRLHLANDRASEHGWLTLLHKPTQSLRPRLQRGTYWRVLGQNMLNHVSLVDSKDSLQALRELMSLCDFSSSATQQLAAVNLQIIEGIKSVKSRPILEPVRSSASRVGMCRGMEVQLEFDEEKYMGTGVFLVASVLERFFALYTAVNSFTRLTARTAQAQGNLKRWPARAGAHRLP
jgi:type VI secretion system protein ImpG